MRITKEFLIERRQVNEFMLAKYGGKVWMLAFQKTCKNELLLLDYIDQLRELATKLTDDNLCLYDGHGFCRTHWMHRPCLNERAKELLK